MSDCTCKCINVSVTLESRQPSEVTAYTPKNNMTVCGFIPGEKGERGEKGDPGPVWLPEVSIVGDLTWTKNETDTPPSTVNILGPQGPQGDKGDKGDTPEVDSISNIEIENLIRSFV